MTAVERALERSRDDLQAARHLAAGGFGAQAASRAYYGAFHAAEACLLARGETRARHSGIIAAFGKLVVREGGFDVETAKALRSLFDRRNEADDVGVSMSSEDAEAAITDAQRFVGAVEAWLA